MHITDTHVSGSLLDDPATTVTHAARIQKKAALRLWYIEQYEFFRKAIKGLPNGLVVELGSGGGFIKSVVPETLTTDPLPLPTCELVVSAESLPFGDSSVRALYMLDVLHHIKNIEVFFSEAERCLAPSGKIVAVEPSHTLWARLFWRFFHHEPYNPHASWKIAGTGPLSDANLALPWIIFFRDRKIFEEKYPALRIVGLRDHTPLAYVLSGGVRPWNLLPGFLYRPLRRFERWLEHIGVHQGMFMTIEVQKVDK